MIRTPVYMDSHATTPVDERVLAAMLPYFTEKFGNPASRQHAYGWAAEEGVEGARAAIAKHLGAEPREVVFTAGASESNNLLLKGIAEALRPEGNHIVTAQTEHKSVLETCRRLEKQGFRITYLPVDHDGFLLVEDLAAAITKETILVSVMHANNEVGTLQPMENIGRLCAERGVIFHSDATQAVGKVPVRMKDLGIDALSCSAHKLYGPKGVGALVLRQGKRKVRILPQIEGGGQERGLRSGTLNVPGIVGFGAAVEIAVSSMPEESTRLAGLRDMMLAAFESEIGGVALNGPRASRLPQNLNVSFLGVEDTTLMMSMKDIAVSSGSACSSVDPQPSHVLKALRLPEQRVHSALRFGLSRSTTEDEVRYVIARVKETVAKLRAQSPARTTVQQPITTN
jgi:cysteine desulfurase